MDWDTNCWVGGTRDRVFTVDREPMLKMAVSVLHVAKKRPRIRFAAGRGVVGERVVEGRGAAEYDKRGERTEPKNQGP